MGILDKIISAKEDSLLKEKASIPLEELIKSKPEHETIFPLEKILTKKNILILKWLSFLQQKKRTQNF